MAYDKTKLKIVPLDFVVMATVLAFIAYVVYRVDLCWFIDGTGR